MIKQKYILEEVEPKWVKPSKDSRKKLLGKGHGLYEADEEVEVANEPNPGVDPVGDELFSPDEEELASKRAVYAIMNSLGGVKESIMTEAKKDKGVEMLNALKRHMPASVRALYDKEEQESLEEAAGNVIIGKDGLRIDKLSDDKYRVEGPWGPFDITAAELPDWVD